MKPQRVGMPQAAARVLAAAIVALSYFTFPNSSLAAAVTYDTGCDTSISLEAGPSAVSRDGRHVAAVCGNQVYYSHDFGTNWRASVWVRDPTDTSFSVSELTITDDGQTMYLTQSNTSYQWGGHLYVSRDGGTSWSINSAAGTRTWWDISSSSNGEVVAAAHVSTNPSMMTPDGSIHISHDYGVTWIKANLPETQFYYSRVSADGVTIIAVSWSSGMWKSVDSGTTWSKLAWRTRSGYISMMAMDDSANHIAVTDADGIWLSVSGDGGSTFSSTSGTVGQRSGGGDYPGSVGHARGLKFSGDGSMMVLDVPSVTDGLTTGAFYSVDSGDTWVKFYDFSLWGMVSTSYDGARTLVVDPAPPTARITTFVGAPPSPILPESPLPPTDYVTSSVTSRSAIVSWTAPTTSGSSRITDYTIEISSDGSTWETVAHSASTLTSISLSGLAPVTTYQVRIATKTAAGLSSPLTGAFTTSAIGFNQLISFGAITNRTLAQPLTFTVILSSDSGLPVLLSADGVCEVAGHSITVSGIGLCTVTASQVGNQSYEPALDVTRSFTISRALLSNRVVSFTDRTGAAAKGLTVTWQTLDGRYRSSKSATTNASGQISYKSIPADTIEFFVSGAIHGVWSGSEYADALITSESASVVVGPDSDDAPYNLTVHTNFISGAPLPGATVTLLEFDPCYSADWNWTLMSCVTTGTTDSTGTAILKVAGSSWAGDGGWVSASYSDGDISQYPDDVMFYENEATIVFEELPHIDMVTTPSLVPYGASSAIVAVALDSAGNPLPGQRLSLLSNVTGASLTKGCTSNLTAVTNAQGRATFKVCPVKTATWSVSGSSLVDSYGLVLTVQLVPSAPVTPIATAARKSVALKWVAPAQVGASKITGYIVQYRAVGGSTWTTMRSVTTLKATVASLTSGQAYEFRIAAKNAQGTGDYSVTVTATPQ